MVTISFAAPVDFDSSVSGTKPASVAIGDLDGGGRWDLVLGNDYGPTGKSATILINQTEFGQSNSISLASRIGIPIGIQQTSLQIGDIDSDGKRDIIASGVVVRNTSSVGSADSASFVPMTNSGGVAGYGIAVGDLDGDGRLDVAATPGSSSVIIFRNILRGSQAITFPVINEKTFGDTPFTVSATASSGGRFRMPSAA